MSTFTYTSDLIIDTLFRANEPTDGTSDYAAEVLVYLNRAYEQVYGGGSEIDPSVNEDWNWLRASSPGKINLLPPYTTGTASVTQGSSTVTLSVAPTISLTGYNLKVNTNSAFTDMHEVHAHTASTSTLTLFDTYTGPTDAAATFTFSKVSYELATDILKLVSPMRVFRPGSYGMDTYKIYGCELDELEERYPLALLETGVPELFAYAGQSGVLIQTGVRVRFSHSGPLDPTDLIRVEYEYMRRPPELTSPGTSEEPRLPLHRRRILADIALAYLLGAKNDERSVLALEMAARSLKGMQRDNRRVRITNTAHNFRLFPRDTDRRRPGPLRTSSGHIIG